MTMICDTSLFLTSFVIIVCLATLKLGLDDWFLLDVEVVSDEILDDGTHYRHTITRHLTFLETFYRSALVVFCAFCLALAIDRLGDRVKKK